VKKKLSPEDAEILLNEDNETWHHQVLIERRQSKALKKDLTTRPEKKWVGKLGKKIQFRD
jgi:hypothetical protein